MNSLVSHDFSWADSGECSRNPGWMNGNCPESCGVCDQLLEEVGKKPHFQLFLSFRFSRFDVLPFHSRSDQGCSSGSEIESRGQTGGERGGGGEEEGGGGGT